MNESVVVQSEHVPDRLAELGLQEAVLHQALNIAHIFAARCTDNHPRIYPGLVMWAETIKALRDLMRPDGWHSQEEGIYDRVINLEGTIGIAVASGNDAIGIPSLNPSNRSPKGRNTVAAVQLNCQLDMFAPLEPEAAEEEEAKKEETWLLLHFFDAVKGERRIELSRPREIANDGRIIDWFERIILTPLSIDGDFDEVVPPEQPDVDFDIERKIS